MEPRPTLGFRLSGGAPLKNSRGLFWYSETFIHLWRVKHEQHDTPHTMNCPTIAQVAAMLKKQGFTASTRSEGCYDRTHPVTGVMFRIHVTDEGSPTQYMRATIMAKTQPNWDYSNAATLESFCTVELIKATWLLLWNSLTK